MVVLGLLSLLIEPKIEHSHLIGPTKVSYSSQFHFPNQNRICIPSYTRNQTPPKLSWQTSRPPPPPINTLIQISHPLIYSLVSFSALRFALLCYLRSQTQWRTRANRPTRESTRYLLNSLLAFFEP